MNEVPKSIKAFLRKPIKGFLDESFARISKEIHEVIYKAIFCRFSKIPSEENSVEGFLKRFLESFLWTFMKYELMKYFLSSE